MAGNPEAVEDGTSGLLVEPEDAAGLAAALGELLADPDRRQEMGEAARQRIEREFSIERVSAAYRRLWLELAESARPPAA